jgi:Protein of unknown function (DUF3237)
MSESNPDETTSADDGDVHLVPLARVSVAAGDIHQIEGGPFGNRVIAGISDGRWDGDRLAGRIVGAGGDWAMPGPGGAMLLDVRQVVETDDGAIVYVTYHGRCDHSRGTYTVAPTFETADERYAWLNAVQAVGKGRLRDGRLEYRMFEVR